MSDEIQQHHQHDESMRKKQKTCRTRREEDDDGGDDDVLSAPADAVSSFFLSDPISDEELQQVEPQIIDNFEKVFQLWSFQGPALLEEYKRINAFKEEQRQVQHQKTCEQLLKDASIEQDARNYQIQLFEIAKRENTIVHLGTGTGKTLIALLLIKHYLSKMEANDTEAEDTTDTAADTAGGLMMNKTKKKTNKKKKNKVVFLVPSVALALQQTMVIRANLHCENGIATASSRTVHTTECRTTELANADVLVATHGAYYELLSYHGDQFRMIDVSLLIVDECHNCIGNSQYAQIMKNYYHTIPLLEDDDVENNNNQRPRVLGLTASPLINVKGNNNNNNNGELLLRKQLETLETLLDARIISPREFGLGLDDDHENNNNQLLKKEAEEKTILYKNETIFESINKPSFPDKSNLNLLKSRRRELNQLDELFYDLGPYIVGIYITQSLIKEIKRNIYENESEIQFQNAKQYLLDVSVFCKELCSCNDDDDDDDDYDPAVGSYYGRTDKLLALEEMILQQIEERPDAVGLVFVERRITALALNEYFSRRLIAQQRKNEYWPDACMIRRLRRNSSNSTSGQVVVQQQQQQQQLFGGDQQMYAGPAGRSVSNGREDNVAGSRVVQQQQLQQRHNHEIPDHVSVNHHTVVGDPSTITGTDVADKATLVNDEDQFMDADSENDPYEAAMNKLPAAATAAAETPHQATNDGTDRCDDSGDDDDPMDIDDQFADADSCDDPSKALARHGLRNDKTNSVPPVVAEPISRKEEAGGHHHHHLQQQGAHSGVTQQVANVGTLQLSSVPANNNIAKHTIRCRALVRKSSNIFRMARGGQVRNEDLKKELEIQQQQETNIREVLSSLRRGDINVLIATSVVEEGVDVRACSFVAAFDRINSTKSYVQMKGRARQEDAKFFAFDTEIAPAITPFEMPSSSLITDQLTDHQSRERAIHEFLSSRDASSKTSSCSYNHLRTEESSFNERGYPLSAELDAVRQGCYQGGNGTLFLGAAKSVLNRFVSTQPMDQSVRLSRASLQSHLPAYCKNTNKLYLPAHIADPSLRVIELPVEYSGKNWKERQNVMAFIACIRLHKCGMLTDSLLPLTREGIEATLVELVKAEEALDGSYDVKDGHSIRSGTTPETIDEKPFVYVYRIIVESEVFNRFRKCLLGSHLYLAVVTTSPFNEVPPFRQFHPQFNEVSFSLAPPIKLECTYEQLDVLSDFFTLLFNSRWKPTKSTDANFRFRSSSEGSNPACQTYRVGCVDEHCLPLWDFMMTTVDNGRRTMKERTDAACHLPDGEWLQSPRIWSPLYNAKAKYIVFGPSGDQSNSRFPHDKEDERIRSYKDYFQFQWDFHVPAESMLFDAQHMWEFPHRHGRRERKEANINAGDQNARFGGGCEGLVSVKLPKHACFEPEMADAALYLLSTFLPQILYHIERAQCAHLFMDHCTRHFPLLGKLLRSLPLADVVSVLSAKSCGEDASYERLEWLGDAVLKLVQTEVILKSTLLRKWIKNMHEGNLDAIRSFLGSNNRLTEICKHLGIDRFIMTAPLNNRQWTPSPLELFPATDMPSFLADGKVCADVIEALLGLAYLHGNFKFSTAVAKELKTTISFEDSFVETRDIAMPPSMSSLLKLVESFTHYCFRSSRELVLEAFTHPTALNPGTPSYQRLEWAGDAVLCLSARCWIFRKFPLLPLKTMVLFESVLVCNETLAFLSVKSGLHKHLLHNDPSLPRRIDWYEWAVKHFGRGLWGTDPPKSIADIVEAVLGAIHIDGGFAEGQQAAEKIIEPVLDLLAREGIQNMLLRHPRRDLLEIGGKMTSLANTEESEFFMENPNRCVWLGKEWGAVNHVGHRSVATVDCLGINLMSVVDDMPSSATNRACAFILAVLKNNPKIYDRFRVVRAEAMQSEATNTDDHSI